jgi:hypothetical protein
MRCGSTNCAKALGFGGGVGRVSALLASEYPGLHVTGTDIVPK